MDNCVFRYGGSHDKSIVYDPEDLARTTVKELTIDDNRVGIVENSVHTNGDGYKVANAEAPNTNRQFTSDYEYTGVADSSDKKPMSYEDIYNMTINEVKEGTLKLRDPTKCNVSLEAGADMVHINIKKLDSDRMNTRNLAKTKVFNSIPQMDDVYITTDKDQLDNKPLADRLDPVMLKSFKQNPFTQSLSSYQYGPNN